jgi:hypothetical protein
MKYGALSVANRALYLAALTESHRIKVSFGVYDGNEALIGPMEGNVLAGQVDVDASADITRTLSMTVEDPTGKFSFDPIGPLYADKFVGVSYSVYVAALSDYVDVPVFFGPVSRYSRDGHTVQVEAVGKESLMMPPVLMNYPATPVDGYVASFIKAAAQAFGETKFRLGSMAGVPVSGGDRNMLDAAKAKAGSVWAELKKLAAAHSFQLFYDAEGYLTARRFPKNTSAHTFLETLNEPSVAFDLTQVRNRVAVFGPDSQKLDAKTTRLVVLDLPSGHPLSAASLARNGTNRVLVENLQSDRYLTPAEATDWGNRYLKHASQGVLSVNFEALVVPHLELHDIIDMNTATLAASFTLPAFTIPLQAADPMTVGYVTTYRTARRYRSIRRLGGQR